MSDVSIVPNDCEKGSFPDKLDTDEDANGTGSPGGSHCSESRMTRQETIVQLLTEREELLRYGQLDPNDLCLPSQ